MDNVMKYIKKLVDRFPGSKNYVHDDVKIRKLESDLSDEIDMLIFLHQERNIPAPQLYIDIENELNKAKKKKNAYLKQVMQIKSHNDKCNRYSKGGSTTFNEKKNHIMALNKLINKKNIEINELKSRLALLNNINSKAVVDGSVDLSKIKSLETKKNDLAEELNKEYNHPVRCLDRFKEYMRENNYFEAFEEAKKIYDQVKEIPYMNHSNINGELVALETEFTNIRNSLTVKLKGDNFVINPSKHHSDRLKIVNSYVNFITEQISFIKNNFDKHNSMVTENSNSKYSAVENSDLSIDRVVELQDLYINDLSSFSELDKNNRQYVNAYEKILKNYKEQCSNLERDIDLLGDKALDETAVYSIKKEIDNAVDEVRHIKFALSFEGTASEDFDNFVTAFESYIQKSVDDLFKIDDESNHELDNDTSIMPEVETEKESSDVVIDQNDSLLDNGVNEIDVKDLFVQPITEPITINQASFVSSKPLNIIDDIYFNEGSVNIESVDFNDFKPSYSVDEFLLSEKLANSFLPKSNTLLSDVNDLSSIDDTIKIDSIDFSEEDQQMNNDFELPINPIDFTGEMPITPIMPFIVEPKDEVEVVPTTPDEVPDIDPNVINREEPSVESNIDIDYSAVENRIGRQPFNTYDSKQSSGNEIKVTEAVPYTEPSKEDIIVPPIDDEFISQGYKPINFNNMSFEDDILEQGYEEIDFKGFSI